MKMTATFNDSLSNEVRLEIVDDSGESMVKSVFYRDFARALSEASEDVGGSKVRLGAMPRGFFDGVIDGVEKDTFSCVLIQPAQVLPVMYYGKTFLEPYPPLLFALSVVGGRLNRSRVYALDKDKPREDSKVYRYPYGNVHSDGAVCWGNVKHDRYESLKQMDQVVATFYGSETNDDLWKAPNTEITTLREMYEHLQGKEEFPLELLRGAGFTLGDLLTKFL